MIWEYYCSRCVMMYLICVDVFSEIAWKLQEITIIGTVCTQLWEVAYLMAIPTALTEELMNLG